jgi:hypothetical protein
MASCKTYSIIKLITGWSFLKALSSMMYQNLLNIYNHLKYYFYGHHDTWLFIPGHTYPLTKSTLYNKVDIIWIYDNTSNILSLNSDEETEKYKFSWLSAKIKITNANSDILEYNLDDFIEMFSIKTTDKFLPNLYTIFLCWCAYTKHWFKIEDLVEFIVIDDCGEDKTYNMFNYNDSLLLQKGKIFIIDNPDLNIDNKDKQDILPNISE